MRGFTRSRTWHWSVNSRRGLRSGPGPKCSKLRTPMGKGCWSRTEWSEKQSCDFKSKKLRLLHTGARMRAAVLRDNRYFTQFEVVRVMKSAACILEKAQRKAPEMIICVNALSFIIYFHINSRKSKNPQHQTSCCGFFILRELLQRYMIELNF